jgi:hypothetical protein
MSGGRKATVVAWVGAAILVVTTLVAGIAVAIARAGAQQVVVPASAANTIPTEVATPKPTILPVPALKQLTPPDVVVTLRRAAGESAVEHLRVLPGIRSVALVDRGSIRLGHTRLRVLGVPLSTIRGFTPSVTATSTALWQSVARGEITVAYAHSHKLAHRLGDTLTVKPARGRRTRIRVGAFATIGLTNTQALVSTREANRLGLARGREVLIAAPRLSIDALRSDVRVVFGGKAKVDVTRAATVNQSLLSAYAQSRIPATYLALYREAAVTCPGLPWTVLAGIGTVETGNGRDVHRSTAGAEGPMQFLPSTWAVWGYDADGDGKADINDPVDAVFSAARYLCAAGAGRGGQSLDDAIFAYNHAWWYVREVIVIANRYA